MVLWFCLREALHQCKRTDPVYINSPYFKSYIITIRKLIYQLILSGLSKEYQSYLKSQYPKYYFPQNYDNNAQYFVKPTQSINPPPNIISQMNDLEHDVSGFHDAMAGMAEAMIMTKQNKDGTFTVEEQVKDADASDLKQSFGDKQFKNKADKRLKKERRRFEKEMVKFFTNFMCGKDCWIYSIFKIK